MTIVKSRDRGTGYNASKVVPDVVERQLVDEWVAGAVFAMARSSTASKIYGLGKPDLATTGNMAYLAPAPLQQPTYQSH